MLRGTCEIASPKGPRLLDLVENSTLFSEHKAGLVKIIGQNHQVLGVNNAIASMLAARRLGHGRDGVGSCHFLDFNWASSSAMRCLSGATAISTSAWV